jgi:hypothetical protein
VSTAEPTHDVDGTAEEVVPYEAPPPALFGTTDPVEVVQRATGVADALADVIRSKKLSQRIQGKDHVLVEGWQLLGVMLGVTAVCVETVPVDGGYKATVEARTADGRVVGRADALCTKHEKRGPWKSADDYARLSMAQTRATSKALKGPLGFVVSLAGYAATPAEEMTFAEPEPAPVPVAAGIPTGDAEALVTRAADLGVLDKLPLAVGHVVGRDVIGDADPQTAVNRLAGQLTADQAARIAEWLDKKAAEVTA